MGKALIQAGQVWIADLYGREARVRIIVSHSEAPQTWICEKLERGQPIGTGSHVALNEKAFLRPASPEQESLDRNE